MDKIQIIVSWLVFAVISFVVIVFSNMHRGIWRYASIRDLKMILISASLISLISLSALFIFAVLGGWPRSLPLINWLVLVIVWSGPRLCYRLWREGWSIFLDDLKLRKSTSQEVKIPILLFGNTDGIEPFLRRLVRDNEAIYHVIGIISPKLGQEGRQIHGINYLGDLTRTQQLLANGLITPRPERLVVALEKTSGTNLNNALKFAERFNLPVSRLPGYQRLEEGIDDEYLSLPSVALEDLLGRPQTSLDMQFISTLISEQAVMVTGAGGSIGSELVRQIAQFAPSKLILLDRSEYALYQIDLEMREKNLTFPLIPIIGDVSHKASLESLFACHRPDLVFHAAALKHVPLVEANPLAGLAVNSLGSRIVADLCHEYHVKLMLQISTDKAVNPTNVMGASKRLAEQYIQACDQHALGQAQVSEEDACRFITVRFGNVLGSTGSVIPLFERQLKQGGPLTVTHPDITRYFMTIREAVSLVLTAAAAGKSDSRTQGGIFVLDMGNPVKILDLAKRMIRLAGLRPEEDIPIKFTGLRPGEKLYEELLGQDEQPLPNPLPGLNLARPPLIAMDLLAQEYNELEHFINTQDQTQAMHKLMKLVPEYKPSSNWL